MGRGGRDTSRKHNDAGCRLARHGPWLGHRYSFAVAAGFIIALDRLGADRRLLFGMGGCGAVVGVAGMALIGHKRRPKWARRGLPQGRLACLDRLDLALAAGRGPGLVRCGFARQLDAE